MNIAVLLKQITYVYNRTGQDPARNFIGPWDTVRLNNPLDEVALEQAVRLRDQLGAGQVSVFSLGSGLVDSEVRRVFAFGADRFIWLRDPLFEHLDAWGAATVLSAAVREFAPDLTLCGRVSLDRGRGEVGRYVAGRLSTPYVGNVIELSLRDSENSLRMLRLLGRGDREEIEARPPVVIGVEKGLCEPRRPSRIKILQARDKKIETWDADRLGLSAEDMEVRTRLGAVVSPRPRTKRGPLLNGDLPAAERIEWLLSRGSGEKEVAMVEGEPGELARRLLEYLQENGFI